MSRNSTTRTQKPKSADAKRGRKGRTTWKSRDMSVWTRNSWRSGWDWIDRVAQGREEGDWINSFDDLNSRELGAIVVTDSRPLDRDQQLAAHTESDNYQVDHYAYLEHPVTGKAKAYLISGGVTTEAVSTGVPYPNVDFIRRGGHAKLIG